jgi:hypothetical protein
MVYVYVCTLDLPKVISEAANMPPLMSAIGGLFFYLKSVSIVFF